MDSLLAATGLVIMQTRMAAALNLVIIAENIATKNAFLIVGNPHRDGRFS